MFNNLPYFNKDDKELFNSLSNNNIIAPFFKTEKKYVYHIVGLDMVLVFSINILCIEIVSNPDGQNLLTTILPGLSYLSISQKNEKFRSFWINQDWNYLVKENIKRNGR